MTTCMFCGQPFDPGGGDHGCPESKPSPSLIDRLREDHRDTIECEHGFLLHRDPCPNITCLGRDLRQAVDWIGAAEKVIRDLSDHIQGVTGCRAGSESEEIVQGVTRLLAGLNGIATNKDPHGGSDGY